MTKTAQHTITKVDYAKLKQNLAGKGIETLSALAPELDRAIQAFQGYNPDNPGKHHVPCPAHGGTDGFRLFVDANDVGGGVCNTCGKFSDAPRLLAWIEAVREHQGQPPGYDPKDTNSKYYYKAFSDIQYYLEHGKPRDPALVGREIRKVEALSPEERAKREQELIEKRKKMLALAQSLYKKSTAGHPAVRKYFAGRGLLEMNEPPMMLLNMTTPYIHPKKPEEAKPRAEYLPAILMPVALGDLAHPKIKALHRIYLQIHSDGSVTKAPLDDAKKILSWSDYRGAAIRLFDLHDSKVLVVAEGPETAVSVQSITGLPTWSLINAGNLAVAEIPDQVEVVLIAADYDLKGAGQKAANDLAKRVREQGKTAVIMLPDMFYNPQNPKHKKGVDWDDVVIESRQAAIQAWAPYVAAYTQTTAELALP